MRMVKFNLFVVIACLMTLFAVPTNVKANIACNDGTTSPSCQDCHRGCCSRHGGCASGGGSTSGSSSSNYSNNYSKPAPSVYVPPKSSDTSLKSITVNGNVISPVSDVNSFTLESNLVTITAEVNDPKSTYRVDGNSNLVVGQNAFNIVVTAENATQKTYVLNVERVIGKSNVTLKLKINGKKVKFNSKNVYKTSKRFKKNRIKLSYTLSDSNSTVKIYKGKKEVENNIKLGKGMNKIKIVITDTNGNENVYRLRINRKVKK